MVKPVKTLYWDDKDKRFVYIIWDGKIARPHKLPRTETTEQEAKKYIRSNKIGA